MSDNNGTAKHSDCFAFEYSFNRKEFLVLAKFLRNCQDKVPVDLENFVTKVEQTVYSSMTINEVEKFYS